MWDLPSIIAENNRQAIQWMMGGQRLERARSPLPESWPLTEICKKLKIGPPLLSELIAGLVDIDSLQQFLELIREYLPEHEEEIMSGARPDRVYRFCQIWAQKYFPLPGWAKDINMIDFSRAMPVELKGMSYNAWHELDMRPGYVLLLSLVVYPYDGDMRDEDREYWLDEYGVRQPEDGTLMEIFNGARVPLIDLTQNLVGPIARRLPANGWTDEELHLMTDGTAYDGVGHFASWVMSKTGCVILDTCYDDVGYMEGWGEPQFRWSEFNTTTLAREWPKLQQIREKIDRIVEWVEEDPVTRFTELLEFLLKESRTKIKKIKNKVSKPGGYDPWDRWSPLECFTDEDEYAEEEAHGINTTDVPEGPPIPVTTTGPDGGVTTREITPEQFVAGNWL